jgi:ABC-type multidrug transport system ATPase subunit
MRETVRAAPSGRQAKNEFRIILHSPTGRSVGEASRDRRYARRFPMSGAEPVLVDIDGVSKSFGAKDALSGVHLRVPAGQICGLLGPNGAGKTTLFRLLMGILKPTAGSMRIGGLDAFEDRVAVKRLVGFLPDEPVFYSYLSGREILELSASMHGLPVADAMQRLAPVVAQMQLADALDRYADEYSRGMKKKLGLLLAVLHQPRLLILDEPTNGLDVEATRQFYDLMHAEAERGTTILFSSHLLDQVTRLCTHAAILSRGRLVVSGAIDALLAAEGDASLEDLFLRLTRDPVS